MREIYLKLAISAFSLLFVGIAQADIVSGSDLPMRNSQEPITTNSVPHIQKGIIANSDLSSELIRQIDALEGVYTRPTSNSLSGAQGFRLSPEVTLARPESLLGGREFAHLHADGSLHVFLPPELAMEVVSKKWGTYHPWAGSNPGWDGFVMLYTPHTEKELSVVVELLNNSYRFVTVK